MIKREHYISQIRSFYESDLIKIITGIRRSGKSVILKQVMDELEKEGKKCIFFDFELRPVLNQFPDADSLIEHIKSLLDEANKTYVFLDEIQNVNDWNEACKTLRLYNCSLFIT
ncbi:MAG: AAA family ATPase, partial [Lachnospiraceae bacterium]|nr:AAA family ATPase [Lachnospiraceae bacterium]